MAASALSCSQNLALIDWGEKCKYSLQINTINPPSPKHPGHSYPQHRDQLKTSILRAPAGNILCPLQSRKTNFNLILSVSSHIGHLQRSWSYTEVSMKWFIPSPSSFIHRNKHERKWKSKLASSKFGQISLTHRDNWLQRYYWVWHWLDLEFKSVLPRSPVRWDSPIRGSAALITAQVPEPHSSSKL